MVAFNLLKNSETKTEIKQPREIGITWRGERENAAEVTQMKTVSNSVTALQISFPKKSSLASFRKK